MANDYARAEKSEQAQSTGSADAKNQTNGAGPLPAISLPKGGGAIRGIGEKFAANPVTGTGSMTVPIATSPGRSKFGPQLSLAYDSGAGNGPYGFGWQISSPAITRKTDKGLPQYDESDVFILSGAEDLVPVLTEPQLRGDHEVQRYRPRIEGLFARIERWRHLNTGDIHWRSITRENVTTIYGKDDNSRLFDPKASAPAVFSWLICESYDDRGNAMVYEYKAEDSANVDLSQAHEANRSETTRRSNRYLKRIKYGNQTSRLVQPDLKQTEWLFEVVFDYGEHSLDDPRPTDTGKWLCRNDPFSSYRSGFELRTYRLCQRILMFHHFPDEENVGRDCLVRSTDFVYRSHPIASFVSALTQTGYKRQPRGGYLKQSLPPLEFTYSDAVIHDEIHELDSQSLENMPVGFDGSEYQWVDLDGEGVSGILTEQADTWFYKPNLGNAQFGPLQKVGLTPSTAALGSGSQQLMDLAGDGRLDLVEFTGWAPGFYERSDEQSWDEFKSFTSLPNVNWNDPNMRFVDLTGDGHADILVTEDVVLTWHASLAEAGFGPAQKVRQVLEEERGARVVFNDSTQSLYLADMSGDGLSDLVRIRNAEVCYWPNLGYGRFGEKVTMDHAPWLDHREQFDQRRVRLADVDGSGSNDLIYLGRDGARIYFNQAGNSFSEPRLLPQFPLIDNLSHVNVVDLFGNGTACLVWSSSLASRPMRYLDLMGGQKPHLLIRAINNLGAETHVFYTSSTKFQQADKQEGKDWITRIPFPVHVVERVETYDRVSRSRFVTRYAYHHGFYDGVEREFRGFGMVEQFDTEEFAALGAGNVFPAGDNFDQTSHVPPVLTRTWFHTGIHFGRGRVSDFFATDEYYREPGSNDAQARQLLLDDTVLPAGLTADEEREACRALKGSMLRQEIYALDGTAKEPHPYTVTEQNFIVRRLQPQAGNRHAVFFTHEGETLKYQYERNPSDPRVSHKLTLELDSFGNVLKSAEVAYGRRTPDAQLELRDQLKQSELHVVYTENQFTNHIDGTDDYRTPLPSETRAFELTGLAPSAIHFSAAEILSAATSAAVIEYVDTPAPGVSQKRLIEQTRTLYRRNDLAGPLALGTVESLALTFENYKLAFTPSILANVFGDRVSDSMRIEGGYVHSQNDQNWWVPSGVIFYSPDGSDSSSQELAFARTHFFLPHRYRDPFHTNSVGTEITVTYDRYTLLPQETRDVLDNRTTVGERDIDPSQPLVRVGHDYRVLQPALLMDPNRNRSAVAFDALGLVAGTVVMGKPEETPVPGDRLDSFVADLTAEEIAEFFADPKGPIAAKLLADATTRVVYDYHAYFREPDPAKKPPVVAAALARTTHASEAPPATGLQIQVTLSYSDGFGREIQKKVQAEPGPLPNPVQKMHITAPGVNPRWAGSGWTIFNNKNKPVRQYEPFFSGTHHFEFAVRAGVSPILFYDPVGRVVATVHPNHTWEKVVFDAWRTEQWDVNDTVLVSDPKLDANVGDFFRRVPDDDYLPTWYALRIDPAFAGNWLDPKISDAERRAAEKTALHAATPSVAYTDSLERTFLAVAHNKFKYSDRPPADPPSEEFYLTRTVYDIEGNERAVVDAKERIVLRSDYDMLSNRIHQASMEAGERWLLNDVVKKPLYIWTSRGHRMRTVYDQLRRPTDSVLHDGAADLVVGRITYGESQPKAELNNLRGKEVQTFDQAGIVSNVAYDFKGNLLRSQRQLASSYKSTIDWSTSVPTEPAIYTGNIRYDALNRTVQMVAPHSDQAGMKINITQHSYNEASLLEQVHSWLNVAEEPAGLLDPATANLHVVSNIDYDAKGRRTRITYGNGVRTDYEYDPFTFRLVHLVTQRDPAVFQNLHYVYDPAGNVTSIYDEAQQAIYFRNKLVEPSSEYTYDAVYRLIEGTGREHLGQVGGAPVPHSYNDSPRVGIDWSANDGNAMGTYLERYLYDAAGNFLLLKHQGSDPVNPGWSRTYDYQEASLIEPGKQSNRVSTTTVGTNIERYAYDAHGSATLMPQLRLMQWNFKDELQMTQRQAVNGDDTDGTQHQGERTFYVYDSSGQRVRKVTESAAGQIKTERIYLGTLEIYRKTGLNRLTRETLHVMDDERRVALVETRTQGNETGVPAQVIRFQHSNHVDSAVLELDERAQILSYEEYTPFGGTSYQAVRSVTDVPKRYRYTSKERDEESGLYYMTARYYASWLGRWVSTDPKGLVDGPNLYAYVRNNPLIYTDPTGTECETGCVDPTVKPTPREEALRQSLPEDQRNLPAQSSDPDPELAKPMLTSLTILMFSRESLAPIGFNGEVLKGPFLTGTGPAALKAVEQAEAAGEGFSFRSIQFQKAVTEEQALAEALKLPGLTEAQKRAIFLRLSKAAARDTAVSGGGLRSMNAAGTIPEGSIQAAEISTFRLYGTGMGALAAGAGVLMLATIDKDDPELVQVMAYGSGALGVFGGAATMYGAVAGEEAISLVGGQLLKGAGYAALPVIMYGAVKSANEERERNLRLAAWARRNGSEFAARLFELRPIRCGYDGQCIGLDQF